MDRITNRFVCYESYDWDRIHDLINDENVKGILLGDLFCHERMFENGVADLILMIKSVLESDKVLVYQAPLFVTSRNIREVRSVLGLISEAAKEYFVIVQDFGTADMVARDFGKLKLVWGQLGRVRELRFSDPFLAFLKDRGFYGFETGDDGMIARLREFDLVPFVTASFFTYKTLGRECYLKYQTGKCDPTLCRSGCYKLKALQADYEMTIDGYMMGKSYCYLPDKKIRAIEKEEGIVLITKEEA